MSDEEFEIDEDKRESMKKFVAAILGTLSSEAESSNSDESEDSSGSQGSTGKSLLGDTQPLRIDPERINFESSRYFIQEYESGYLIIGKDFEGSPGNISRAQVEAWPEDNFWKQKIEEYRSASQQMIEFEPPENIDIEQEWYENPIFNGERLTDVNYHDGNLEIVFPQIPDSVDDDHDVRIGQSYEAQFIAGKTYIHFYDKEAGSWHEALQDDGDLELLGEIFNKYRNNN